MHDTTPPGVGGSPHSNLCKSTGKQYSIAFNSMITLYDFVHRLKSQNHHVEYNKQNHRNKLLNIFNLNGDTLGFHPHADSKVRNAMSNGTTLSEFSIAFISTISFTGLKVRVALWIVKYYDCNTGSHCSNALT